MPIMAVPLTELPAWNYLRHPRESVVQVTKKLTQELVHSYNRKVRITAHVSPTEHHLHDRRSHSCKHVLRKKSMSGANLTYRRKVQRRIWPLQKQNRMRWHRLKIRRWKEHDHLKKELLKITIPKGKTHLEDLMGPLSISNKDHFPDHIFQGKLWTCSLQAQLVSKCLHKKHNNNCLKERCSNLHETLSSR